MERRGDEETKARDRALSGAEKNLLANTALSFDWSALRWTFALLKCPLLRLVFEAGLVRSHRVCVVCASGMSLEAEAGNRLNRLCARSPEHSGSMLRSAYILPKD